MVFKLTLTIEILRKGVRVSSPLHRLFVSPTDQVTPGMNGENTHPDLNRRIRRDLKLSAGDSYKITGVYGVERLGV